MTTATATAARTANDVANLFLDQKLADEKSHVERWQRELLGALQEENMSAATHKPLCLYDTCIDGRIDAIISHKQGVWLYKMLTQEQRWNKRTPHMVIYQGRELGSWTYREATSHGPYERMTFRIDPAFMRDYTGVDLTIWNVRSASSKRMGNEWR
jgi:hypothetical protein